MELKIFNPNSKPFGKLSNNYPVEYEHEGRIRHMSVTNYVLSNMVSDPMHKKILETTSLKPKKQINTQILEAIDYLLFTNAPKMLSNKYVQKQGKFGKIMGDYRKFGGNVEGANEFVNVKNPDYLKDKELREQYRARIALSINRPFSTIDLHKLRSDIIRKYETDNLGLYDMFNVFIDRERADTMKNAVEISYTKLLEEDQKLQQLLLDTGNSPIIYESPDKYLGGQGHNFVGKILEQLRHNINIHDIVKKEKEETEQVSNKVYSIYLAYNILKRLIEGGDMLHNYIDVSPENIVEQYGKHNITNIEGILTNEQVYRLYTNNGLNSIINQEIQQPGTLVVNVRKFEIRKYQLRQISKKTDIIFNLYLRYMISRNYNLSVEEEDLAFKRQLASMDPIQEKELKSRIVDLFNMGMLSGTLSDQIDNEIARLNIPTNDEVREAETVDVIAFSQEEKVNSHEHYESDSDSDSSGDENPIKKVFRRDSKDKLIQEILSKEKSGDEDTYSGWSRDKLTKHLEYLNKKPDDLIEEFFGPEKQKAKPSNKGMFTHNQGPPFIIKMTDIFSPHFERNIRIESKNYPSIHHYIITRLIASSGARQTYSPNNKMFVKGMGMVKAYKYIINKEGGFVSIDELIQKYQEIHIGTQNFLLSTFAIIATNKKFENRSLQNLLLLTGNKELIWNDVNDNFLGIGDGSGENYSGKFLMSLREDIRKRRSEEEIIFLDQTDLLSLINDDFVYEWIKNRIGDMCKIVEKMYNHVRKDVINLELNDKFIKRVINNICTPCSNFKYQTSYMDKIPHEIIDIVSSCSTSKIKGLQTRIRNKNLQKNTRIQANENNDGKIISNEIKELGFDVEILNLEIKELKSELEEEIYKLTETSKIYWNNIEKTLSTLLREVRPPTPENIRRFLLDTPFLPCKKYVNDPETNCVISALINVSKGIHTVNKLYSNNIKFSSKDIDMAASIILEKDVRNIVENPEHNVVRASDLPSGYNPYFNFGDDSDSSDSEDEKSNILSVRGKDSDLSKIYQEVLLIDDGVDPDLLSKYIRKSVKYIKKYMYHKKQRVNFFSNICTTVDELHEYNMDISMDDFVPGMSTIMRKEQLEDVEEAMKYEYERDVLHKT